MKYLKILNPRGDNFYPRTGAVEDVGSGPGRGFTVNIPWQRGGLGDADYLEAFRQVENFYLYICV